MGENIPKMVGPNSTTCHHILSFIILGNGPHLSALPYTGKPIKSLLILYPTFLLELTKIYLKNRTKKFVRNVMRILLNCIIFL
jgi:hypothetical protein